MVTIGAPEWMQQPTSHLLKQSERFAPSQDELIQERMRRYQEKVQRLDELWRTEEATHKLVDEILNLQLEGKYDEALSILRKQINEGNSTYAIWRMRAEIAYELSNQHLSKKSLKECITAWKHVLTLAPQQKDINVWCEVNLGLGNALVLLYDLDRERKHLKDAISIYQAALNEDAWVSTSTNRAEAQNNLGSALQTLGDLEDNIEHLEKAVIAYKAALGVYTRKSAPQLWARTQDHLGGALLALGRTKNNIKLLEKSAAAYQGALEFYQEAGEIDLLEAAKKNLQQVQILIKKLKITSKR